MVYSEETSGYFDLSGRVVHPTRRHVMGEKGSKKDKDKAKKQKQQQIVKKQEQQKAKLPAKKPV